MVSMHSLVMGLNIKSAPIELLEKLSIHHASNADRMQDLKAIEGISAAVVLRTCNRLEFYVTCEDVERDLEAVQSHIISQCSGLTSAEVAQLRELMYAYSDNEATRHLFEVVTGLDSLIVGEAEILGQISRAYKTACEAGTTNKYINVWFQRALHLGKKARSETNLGRYSISVGRIAVELAVREFGDIKDKRVLILGAGEMSELTMKYLIAHKFSVVMVTNRSFEKAHALAEEYGFDAYPISSLEECLEKADVVFSATSSKKYIIDKSMVEHALACRQQRPLLFVDMAVPRDIDPDVETLENVHVHNINELRDVADRNRFERALAAKKVRQLIEEEVTDFEHWVHTLELVPTITAFRQHAESIKKARLDDALSKLSGLTPSQMRTVCTLATTITDQFLHDPIESLNTQAGSNKTKDYAQMLQELFDLKPELMTSGDEKSPGEEAKGAPSR